MNRLLALGVFAALAMFASEAALSADVAGVTLSDKATVGGQDLIKEVRENDVVTLDFVEATTPAGLDGQVKGTIAVEAFNQSPTRVWLGDKPAQADLRKALRGG